MKIGNKILCKKDCIVGGSGRTSITKGKYYTVIILSDTYFVVKDNYNERHRFTFKNSDNWFATIKEMRKLKLEKIKKIY